MYGAVCQAGGSGSGPRPPLGRERGNIREFGRPTRYSARPYQPEFSMSRSAAFTPAVGLLLGLSLSLACGGFGSDSSRSSYGKRAGATTSSPEEYESLDQGYRVAPDRAIYAMTLHASAKTVAAAAALLTAEVAALETASAAACPSTWMDHAAPSGAGDEWSTSAELRLDVDLRGLATVAERRARIDACAAAIAPRITDAWSDVGQDRRYVGAAGPVLTVDQPDLHRDALLERVRARLSWAAAATGAPQLHPTDLRCVPDGTVNVLDRRLSGVQLGLSMPCGASAPRLTVAAEGGDVL
jgi:hypothetical protein